ncbi:MAG: hypothetical protein WB495_04115 [Xanthobacteraceae bacterium]
MTVDVGLGVVSALRILHRPAIRCHRIAESLPFRLGNSIELHPELENCHRHQLRRLSAGAGDQDRPALLEGRKSGMQSLF